LLFIFCIFLHRFFFLSFRYYFRNDSFFLLILTFSFHTYLVFSNHRRMHHLLIKFLITYCFFNSIQSRLLIILLRLKNISFNFLCFLSLLLSELLFINLSCVFIFIVCTFDIEMLLIVFKLIKFFTIIYQFFIFYLILCCKVLLRFSILLIFILLNLYLFLLFCLHLLLCSCCLLVSILCNLLLNCTHSLICIIFLELIRYLFIHVKSWPVIFIYLLLMI
jgi:hypothetical protein